MKQIIKIAPLADYFVVAIKDKSTGELKETFTLNESAADMLRLICEGKDSNTVAQEIADIYNAPIELITKDVTKLIERLRQKRLI